MGEVIGFTAEFEGKYRGAPAWGRTSHIQPQTRQVFVPAVLGGDETTVLLCALHDAVGVVRHEGHAYVPAEWMAREYPEAAGACEKIVARTRDALDRERPPAPPGA